MCVHHTSILLHYRSMNATLQFHICHATTPQVFDYKSTCANTTNTYALLYKSMEKRSNSGKSSSSPLPIAGADRCPILGSKSALVPTGNDGISPELARAMKHECVTYMSVSREFETRISA